MGRDDKRSRDSSNDLFASLPRRKFAHPSWRFLDQRVVLLALKGAGFHCFLISLFCSADFVFESVLLHRYTGAGIYKSPQNKEYCRNKQKRSNENLRPLRLLNYGECSVPACTVLRVFREPNQRCFPYNMVLGNKSPRSRIS